MTTPARQSEADRVELVYYWALNQLGAAVAIDARELYAREMPERPNPASTSWLTRLLALMFGFRSEAHDLAVAYYRLNRALRTGYTVATGDEVAGETTSIEALRAEFEDIVDRIDVETGDGDGTVPPRNLYVVDEDDDVEFEDGGDIDALIEQANDQVRDEALEELDQLGVQNLLNDLERGKDAAEAYETARNRGAAAAMRITMNASRGLTYDLADTDLRVQGWVRYSQTGTPCGWCAMLISRGVVYKTRASASAQRNDDGNRIVGVDGEVSDVDKFHTNCHCVAVPIFFTAQYDGDLFALNREFDALWQSLKRTPAETLIERYGTSDLLVVFRQIMRDRQRQADTTPEAPALEAA